MTVPILSTKLHIPPTPGVLVERKRLTAQLDAGARGKLILVSAPAGFGKTSLIAEWANINRGEYLVSWVHLDAGDNELIRFFSYIIAALQSHQENLGEVALVGLQSIPPPPTEAILVSLINEIDNLQGEIILVLDDYHLIEDTSIHEAVGFLIENIPTNMCLVMATRTDPPLPIHRLRARGQMKEIRVGDLRFSKEETRAFLEGILGISISSGQVTALEKRVEGWAAGLQMVALSMQDRQDIDQFVQTFTGSHRYIMDYLTEEIFNQQPPHIQTFLLGTSILERLSGPLCEALLCEGMGEQESQLETYPAQHTLECLERANLFLLPLDQERHWYRYHRLFAVLLRQRLRNIWPEEIPGLLLRASEWFAVNGYAEEAIEYALEGDHTQRAAQLVEQHALALLNAGALSSLSGWLNKLPEEVILGSWVLLLTGNFENLERYLSVAEQGRVSLDDGENLGGHIAAIRAYASAMQGEIDLAISYAEDSLDLLPEDERSVRCVVEFALGGVYFMREDFPNALITMQKAGQTGEKAGNFHLAVSAWSAAGDLLRSQGKLREAESICEHALDLGTGRSGRPLPYAASVYSSLAELYLARNELAKARNYAQTGVELAQQWGNVDSLTGSYLVLATIASLEGNSDEAEKAISEAKHLAATHNLSPGFVERIAAVEDIGIDKRAETIGEGFLIEPLSDRELEVLRLMAKGRSNAEIAEELIIALGTVKAHTSTIYRKLDVRSRTEAVIKGRELGLI
jgi:LuxR family maltose regulon positive regulatory protein